MVRIAGGYRFDVEDGRLKKTWFSWDHPDETVSGLARFLQQNSLVYKVLGHPDSKFVLYVQDVIDSWAEEPGETQDTRKSAPLGIFYPC